MQDGEISRPLLWRHAALMAGREFCYSVEVELFNLKKFIKLGLHFIDDSAELALDHQILKTKFFKFAMKV